MSAHDQPDPHERTEAALRAEVLSLRGQLAEARVERNAAWAAGAEAMREAAGKACKSEAEQYADAAADTEYGRARADELNELGDVASGLAAAIRALPLPPPPRPAAAADAVLGDEVCGAPQVMP